MSSVTRSPAAMELTADTMFSVAASLTVRIAQFYNYKINNINTSFIESYLTCLHKEVKVKVKSENESESESERQAHPQLQILLFSPERPQQLLCPQSRRLPRWQSRLVDWRPRLYCQLLFPEVNTC